MIVERTSVLTGKRRQVEIAISPIQMKRIADGEFIQNVCPHLSTDQREFILSGITPEEWSELFPEFEINSDNGEQKKASRSTQG